MRQSKRSRICAWPPQIRPPPAPPQIPPLPAPPPPTRDVEIQRLRIHPIHVEMINAGHREISWSSDGTLVVVTNAERLAEHILPQYFKHGQYASWVRALNAYDFKKSGAGRWHHPSFLRGHPELLKNIRRKAPPSRGPGVRASAASSSTALVPRAKKAPISPDLELRWMQQELNRLQGEVGAIRNEDFQQRFD